MSTANKGYATPVTGTQAGLWGDILNSDVFQIVDNNMGGIVTKSLSSSNVTLSATESQMVVVRLTGTILSNIQVTTSCIGFFFVENLTTGNFDITVTNGVAGVVVPKGRSTVLSDASNGCRIGGTDSVPTGTKMLFFQTLAPTGYTKDTSLDDATIRLVSGAVGADGGTFNFTNVFTARAILQANIPSYSLPVSDPGHSHITTIQSGIFPTGNGKRGLQTVNETPFNVQSQGSFTGISVNSGGSGVPMDFAVKYASAIRATKN